MTNPAPLSRAAQVMIAVTHVYQEHDGEPPARAVAAAALRATADCALCSACAGSPSTDWGDGWKTGIRDTAQGLRSIAAELEGATTTSENVLDS